MLVLTAYKGDNTTISLPSGDTISIVLIDHRHNGNQATFGIHAPEKCLILRDSVRQRIVAQLRSCAVFQVSSMLHQSWLIAAEDVAEAIRFYQQQYPEAVEVQAGRVDMARRPLWLDRLAAHSEEPICLPVGVVCPDE